MRTRRRTYAQIVDARQWHVSLQHDDGGIEWTLEEIGRLSCSAVKGTPAPSNWTRPPPPFQGGRARAQCRIAFAMRRYGVMECAQNRYRAAAWPAELRAPNRGRSAFSSWRLASSS
jgi:hypothetical protein